MIDLRVLGRIDLRDRASGAPVASVLAQPKRTALLAWLAMATPRGAHRRDTVLALFWPESSEDRARNALNQAVFNLRRSLGEDSIESTAQELRLSGDVWCVAVAFDDALAAGDSDGALALYHGELLPGFHLDGCPDFVQWLDAERERRRRQAVAAALRQAASQERNGNGVAALERVRQAAEWSPYDEPVARRLVVLLAGLGDRTGALREARRFADRLDHELGLPVSPDFLELLEEVHRQTAAAPPPPTQADPPTGMNAAVQPGRRKAGRHAIAGALAVFALTVVLAGRGSITGRLDRRAEVAASGEVEPSLDARRVFVAALDNRTGEPALDPLGYMAADWIAHGLARTGIARVVPFSTVVQEMLHLPAEGDTPDTALTTAIRQRAGTSGAGTLVAGAYYRIGDSLAFQTQVIDVRTGELLRGIEVTTSAVESAAAVEELQRRSLGALAALFDERLDSRPDAGGQPSSLEAYQLFSDGMRIFMSANNHFNTAEGSALFASAAQRFRASASLDSAFVSPLLWAVYAHVNAGDTAAADTLVQMLEHRPHTPWTRAVLNHQLAVLVRDDEAAYHAARELGDLSPDSEWLFKLAFSAYQTRRYREALDVYLRMDPERGWIRGWGGYWRLRTELQHIVGDHRAALTDARRGLADHPDDTWLGTQELWALAALGRSSEITERLAPGVSAGDPFALWQLGTVLEELHGHGQAVAAQRLTRQLLPRARAAVRAADTGARAELAHVLYRAGHFDEAGALYRTLSAERPRAIEFRLRLAMLAIGRGDAAPAAEVLERLARMDGESVARAMPSAQLRYWGTPAAWRALAQARLAASLGDHDTAITALRDAGEGGLQHAWLHVHDDPDFDGLRRLPAFQQLFAARH